MIPVYNEVQFASGTATNVGAATEVTLTVASARHTVEVLRVKLKHTAGSAVSFVPRIHSATGGVAEAIDEEFVASSTLVANLCDVAVSGVICETDSAGRLYLIPAPNTGSNNTFSYVIAYRILP